MPNSQDEFEYTDEVLTIFEKFLSPERLAAYYALARGDKWVAIHLYERNTEISEALYGVLQGLEVALRNAIHNVLTKGLGAPDWYDKIHLQNSELEALRQARSKIAERMVEETPGRIVAELTFAFWVRLLAWPYEKSLWVPHLRRIFPMRFTNPSVIHGRLVELKTLRNRIAHHERILGRDLEKDYAALLETIGWVSPDVREWVRETNCFEERFAKRIPKKPKPQLPEAEEAISAEPSDGA
ncbi:MAG TPA: Abi family protein [Candidatus Angelobacter sp.]|nr:Abi family protein [Candidatus Angelobacter sp.]